MKFGLKTLVALCLPLVFVVALAIQSNAADAMTGADLYKKCVGCHSAKPKFAGKPVEDLNKKMMHYRDGKFESPKVVSMQKSFKGMSDADLMVLAKYLNMMK